MELKAAGRILKREIIHIQKKKKKYKRMRERVPPEIAQQLRNAKGAFTQTKKEWSKEENKKHKGFTRTPVEELEKQGKKVGRPRGSKNKPKAERMAILAKRDEERELKKIMNKMVRVVEKKSEYEKKIAEGKIAPKGATTRSRAKAGKA